MTEIANKLVRPQVRTWPELLDTFESIPAMFGRGLGFDTTLRVEQEVTENEYVIKAEIPGVDPEQDVNISLENGVLSITAERMEKEEGQRRSEFRYGKLTRRMSVPAGMKPEDIKASYDKGILEVHMPLEKLQPETARIPVQIASK